MNEGAGSSGDRKTFLAPDPHTVGESRELCGLNAAPSIMAQNSWIALRKNLELRHVHYFCEAQ